MKGVIFTELLEMAEGALSPEVVEEVIAEADLESGGAYTSIGTYPFSELQALIVGFAARMEAPVPEVIHGFGGHLFQAFQRSHSAFFTDVRDTFDLLRRVEDEIHVEVRKLYPDAELPTFACSEPILGDLILEYRSTRGLADLAAGLLDAAIAHFGESIAVERQDLSGGQNTHVVFTLRRA